MDVDALLASDEEKEENQASNVEHPVNDLGEEEEVLDYFEDEDVPGTLDEPRIELDFVADGDFDEEEVEGDEGGQ